MNRTTSIISVLAGLAATSAPSFAAMTNDFGGDAKAEKHLKILDKMDFEIWSNQLWDRLGEVQADDMTTTYADGSSDRGYAEHLVRLKYQFSFAPDTKIASHPIRFGSGSWAVVSAPMEGTFTMPLVLPSGKTIPPNGKRFLQNVITIAHFDANEKVEHQWVFYDNDSFMKQLGIAP